MGVNFNRIFYELHQAGYGERSLFTGLKFALMSRLSHLFTRNTIYYMIYQKVKPPKARNDLTFGEKSLLSGFAGGIGAIVSNPFEILYIRQIGDLGRSQKFDRNISNSLSNVFTVNSKIGMHLNILKAIVLNVSMTYPYNYLKESMWITFGPNITNKIVAVLGGTAVGTLCSLPIDNIKTRLQYAFDKKSLNRVNYSSTLKALSHVITNEISASLWVGLFPYYLKNLVYASCTLLVSDYFINNLRRKNGVKDFL